MHCGSSIYFCGHFISVEPGDLRNIPLIKRYKEQRRDIGRAYFGLAFFANSFFWDDVVMLGGSTTVASQVWDIGGIC